MSFEPTKRHLWFMYAIIGIYIVLPFVQKMCKNLSKVEENLFMVLWAFFCRNCIFYKIII